jgi:lipopolysaccharide transport system permease protein
MRHPHVFEKTATSGVLARRAVVRVLGPGQHLSYWRELWRYRELLYFLAWRDTLVRYKQTAIGIAWALIRPIAGLIVFLMFRRFTGLSDARLPEPVLVFAGMLVWQFFSSALADAANSLIADAHLISKVYFPRIIVPIASVVTTWVDALIGFALLAALMAWHHLEPSWRIAVLPAFILLLTALSTGAGLLLAALNVKYRDFRYVVPFLTQFGLFVSPVAFTIENVPESWRALYALNPMVGIMDGVRWSVGAGSFPLSSSIVLTSVAVSTCWLCIGFWYFRRVERTFADVI